MGKGRDDTFRGHGEDMGTALGESQEATSMEDTRRTGRIMHTRACLSVMTSTVNGTELGAQERRNSLFLRYVSEPP